MARHTSSINSQNTLQKPVSIREYFRGKNLFLSGCTGLLGKVILEKILRCLPEICSITLLIRPRETLAGKCIDARERFLNEVIDNSLFDQLRAFHGDGFGDFIAQKLHFLNGDLLQDKFGQNNTTWQSLCDRVNLVIHSAATVNLFERLDLAIALNIDGPLRILEFARSANAALVQISTAYVSGCLNGIAAEEIVNPQEAIEALKQKDLPSPKNFDVVKEISRLKTQCEEIKAAGETKTEQEGWQFNDSKHKEWIRKKLMQAGLERSRGLGWMDTYTFTKFLGEQMLARHRGSVPVIIVRPSIIESILNDPEPGWLQNYRMADPVIMSFAKGRLFDFPGCADAPLDLIPVDLVVNGILASAAYLDRNKGELEVVHIATSARNPLTLKHLHEIKKKFFTKEPLKDRNGDIIPVPDWRFISTEEFMRRYDEEKGRLLKDKIRSIETGQIIEKKIIHKVRREWVEYEKIRNMADQYGPYTTMNCRFDDRRAAAILDCLHPQERVEFNFDPRQFTWEEYLSNVHIPGVKRNILRLAD